MSRAAEMLEEFHTSYEIPVDQKQKNLRLELITEEYTEVFDILETVFPERINRKHLAQELADLLYVIYGTALVYNIDLDIALQQVHGSNMSKLGEDGRPIKRNDGKILKGPNYFEPDMSHAVRN